ncbi:MAG: hypothetical protein ACOC5S_02195 [Acidobacteriota bacterium]
MNDSLKKAIKFISDNIKLMPKKDRLEIIEMAAKRFELNPKQEEFLIKKFVKNE